MLPASRWLHLVAVFIVSSAVFAVPTDYAATRQKLIEAEQSLRTGGNGSTLTPEERVVDNLLMAEKLRIMEASRRNGAEFFARYNFLNQTSKAAMESTKAFQIIRRMPKGGLLHIHDEALTSLDWLVKNVTYRDNCYMCVNSDFFVKFHFFQTPPSETDCVWTQVSALRAASGDVDAFDESLHRNLTLVTSDPSRAYPSVDAVWSRFMDYFGKAEGLMLYAPVFRDYLWEGLLQCREDNVQYLEIRGLLPQVYELDGTAHDVDWVLNVYKQGIAKFVQQYPDFTGGRFIKTSLRFKPINEMKTDVLEAMRLYQQNKDFVVGFDLVGQEDPLHPLYYYIDALLYPSQQTPPVHLPYFFHAGETDWGETETDYNLVDALLLNTTRIGHGYALHKHPLLKQKIKEHDIAIEVNPISNQVLNLVSDPRNHPAASLIAENYPLVISSDDPAVWEALPLSHDFYITFMALMGEKAGLATLKQLAINSLTYSALSTVELRKALIQWQEKWHRFINDIVREAESITGHDPIIG